jgi:hypothetical protein
MDEGHCGLPVDELTNLTVKLIEVSPGHCQVNRGGASLARVAGVPTIRRSRGRRSPVASSGRLSRERGGRQPRP